MNRLPKYLAGLRLDFDRKRVPLKRIGRLLHRAGYKILRVEQRQSQSGGWHVYLSIRPAPRTPMEVIALQSLLGSDPFREAMNVARARKLWRTPGFAKAWWNVLYRPRTLPRFPLSHFR